MLGAEHPQTLATMFNLAHLSYAQRRYAEAEPLFTQVLEVRRRVLGTEFPDTIKSMNALAALEREQGRYAEAARLYTQVLDIRRRVLGPTHPETMNSLGKLAWIFWRTGRLDRSIPLFEEALKLRESTLPHNHPDTLANRANLGVNYRDAGRLDEAISLLKEASVAGGDEPAFYWIENELLETYIRAEKTSEATILAKESLPVIRAKLPPGSSELAGALAGRALVLLHMKAWDEAEPILRESLTIRQRHEPDAWTTSNTQSLLGGALFGQHKFDEAEPLLIQGYRGMQQRVTRFHPRAWYA